MRANEIAKIVVSNQDVNDGIASYTLTGGLDPQDWGHYELRGGHFVDLDNEPELEENWHTLGWIRKFEDILEIHYRDGRIERRELDLPE